MVVHHTTSRLMSATSVNGVEEEDVCNGLMILVNHTTSRLQTADSVNDVEKDEVHHHLLEPHRAIKRTSIISKPSCNH